VKSRHTITGQGHNREGTLRTDTTGSTATKGILGIEKQAGCCGILLAPGACPFIVTNLDSIVFSLAAWRV
jgi:hypothetical protein